MIYSMTGVGAGSATSEDGTLELEIRSVNSRFLDIHWRGPRSWDALEEKVTKKLKERLSRGRVSVTVRWVPPLSAVADEISPEGVRATLELLRGVSEEAGLPDGPTLDHLLRFERYWLSPQAQLAAPQQLLEKALNEALDTLLAHRAKEAEDLLRDMRSRLNRLASMTTDIRDGALNRIARAQEQFHERIQSLLQGQGTGDVNEGRLETELALLAQRQDTTEECVRLDSHIRHFSGLLDAGSPVGRKLEFLLQEMHRECTTLGAKAADADVSQAVVEMKAELEKLREQCANLE